MDFDGKDRPYVSQSHQKKIETKEQFLQRHKNLKVIKSETKQQTAAATTVKAFLKRWYTPPPPPTS